MKNLVDQVATTTNSDDGDDYHCCCYYWQGERRPLAYYGASSSVASDRLLCHSPLVLLRTAVRKKRCCRIETTRYQHLHNLVANRLNDATTA
jgi:hypothetical protein